jgi:hypothetical protein
MDKTSLLSFTIPVLLSVSTALAAPPAATPRPPVGKPAAKPPVKKPVDVNRTPEPPKGCSPMESGFVMTPIEVSLKCDETWDKCESDIPLRAKNCTGEFKSI